MIIQFLNVLSYFTRIGRKVSDRHYEINKETWEKHYVNRNKRGKNIFCHEKYISNQDKLNCLLFGKTSRLLNFFFNRRGKELTADFNSCEVVAVMNALISLGKSEDASGFPKLLRYFENHRGLALNGYFGTAPVAMWRFLKEHGVRIVFFDSACLWDNESLDNIGSLDNTESLDNTGTLYNTESLDNKESLYDIESKRKTYIIVFQNNKRKLSQGIHSVCAIVDINGARLLNDYENSPCYQSLSQAIKAYNNGRAKVLQLAELG